MRMNTGDDGRSARLDVALVALSVALGMQMVRAVAPLAFYLLYSSVRLHPAIAGAMVVPVFAAGLCYPALARRLGPRAMVAGAAGVVALMRLGAQVSVAEPLVALGFVAVGAAAFFVLVPAIVSTSGAPRAALLAGFALDTAMHAAFGTYDPIWRQGALPLVSVAGPVLIVALAVWRGLGRDGGPARETRDVAWEAVGAFLFLQLAVFQNAARVAALTGCRLSVALACVAAAQALGVAVASSPLVRTGWVGPAAVLLVSLAPVDHPAFVLGAVVTGQVALALLMMRVVEGRPGPQPARAFAYVGLACAGLIGVFYLGVSSRVGYRSEWVYLLAAAIVIFRAAKARGEPVETVRWTIPAAAALAVAAPVALSLAEGAPRAEARAGAARPVRVMSFNVHKGFDTRGRLDLESLAEVIEAERPDVVALQEVSRGQMADGCVDMASWLSRRLGVPCVYAPSGARLWGQAVLTGLPVLRAEHHLLPPFDLPTARSYGDLDLDAGWGEPLRLINTHYSAALGTENQLAHSRALAPVLAAGDGRRTVLAGDLNATPLSAPVRTLVDVGLVDSVDEAGISPGYTAPAINPTVRIDYVLHTDDLAAEDVTIRPTLVSDHFPVVTTIVPR